MIMCVFSAIERSTIARTPTETVVACARKPVDDRVLAPRSRPGTHLPGVVGRGVDRRRELGREHDAHDLADRVRRGHARRCRAGGDLLRERRLAHAGRAREQQDHRALGLLERAPDPVAAGHALAHRAHERLGHERAERVAVHLRRRAAAAARPRSRARPRRPGPGRSPRRAATGRARPSRRACGARPRPRGSVRGSWQRQILEPARPRRTRPRSAARAPRGAPAARPRIVSRTCVRGAEGVLEAHAAGHQRVDHDPAHEGTPAEGVLDLGSRRRCAAPGCLGSHRAKLTDGALRERGEPASGEGRGPARRNALQLASRPIVFR